MTAQEILSVWVQEARDRLTWDLLKLLHNIDRGKPAYHQFTMTFDEALETTAEVHGKKERQELVDDMMSIGRATKKLVDSKLPALPADMQEMLDEHLKR